MKILKYAKVFLAIVLVALTSVVFTGCANKAKIGYFDIQKVSENSPKLKQLNEKFQKDFQNINSQMEALTQKQGSMSKEEYNKEFQALEKKAYGVKNKYISERQNLLNGVLAKIYKEDNLSVITVKTMVNVEGQPQKANVNVDGTVVNGGVDITDEIIKNLQ